MATVRVHVWRVSAGALSVQVLADNVEDAAEVARLVWAQDEDGEMTQSVPTITGIEWLAYAAARQAS